MRFPIEPGSSAPRVIAGKSIVSPASRRTGSTTALAKFVARFPSSKSSSFQASASTPAVIEPPETLDTRATPRSSPSSFSRQSAPRWKSIAR